MKILLLGGTGILSTDFTRKTLDENNDVWILNRGKRKPFLDPRAKLITADLRNEAADSLAQKFQGMEFDVIVDYLSFKPEQLEKSLSILEGKFKQYILISSATAYVKQDGDIIKEDSHDIGNAQWDYSHNKSLCEAYIKNTDIQYTIVRPYVTYGESRLPFQIIPDGYHYTLIQRILNNKPVVLLDGGEAVCTLTNTIDFANVMYRLLLNKKVYRQAFHITSPFCQSWRTVYETYCALLGRESRLVSVTLDDIRKYMPEYYQPLKGDKGTSWRFDNSKVLEAIGGYAFEYDLWKGLSRSIQYYEAHREMQSIDYKWEGKIDYLIARTAHCGRLKILRSDNEKSNKKLYYWILSTPVLHEAFMALHALKHGKKG